MSNQNPSVVLCQPSTGQESDWSKLYESAFPADERMALADVQAMLSNKTMLLHRTTDAAGDLLCFSLVTPMSNFSLLAYIATDQTKRSTGVGSKHMKELISVLKATYSQSQIGLFLEIESTREANLSVDESATRQRRLAFYQRLNCNRLCGKDYFLPSYAAGVAHRAGELLWYEFASPVDNDSTIAQVITEIYTRGYGIPATHATYVQVLAQFAGISAGDYSGSCPTVTPAALPSTTAPVASATAESATATPVAAPLVSPDAASVDASVAVVPDAVASVPAPDAIASVPAQVAPASAPTSPVAGS